MSGSGGFKPSFHITHRMTGGLTRIERARGFLEAARLSEDWLATMRSRAFVLEAHHTTHIEGTRLTLEQVERLLAGEAVAGTDPDDARELLNYRDAFEFVSGYLNDGGPVTEGLIREIHRRLVVGVRGGSAAPGEYRRMQNYVVNAATGQTVYAPPPPYDVPPLMAELVTWLNMESDVHPVLVSGVAQFQLVHIHPFVDGNGRTSRLLSTFCLYRAGYDFKRLFSISEYYDRDRTGFYGALQSMRDSGMDLTGWLDYFVEGLATQMDELTERGKRAIKTDIIGAKHGLNARQKALVLYLMEQPETDLQAFQALAADVPPRTLQRDLQQAVAKRVLLASGATHRKRYRLNDEIT
jgi:Fic family protein